MDFDDLDERRGSKRKPSDEYDFERRRFEHEIRLQRYRTATAIIVALIGMIVALIPTNPPNEPYKPLAIAIASIISNGNSNQPPVATEVVITPSATNTASPLQTPTFEPTREPDDPLPSSTPRTSAPLGNVAAAEDLNRILGQGNWFCFPHTTLEVAYRNASEDVMVQPPISYVDYFGVKFSDGQAVPAPGGATVRLLYPIPRTECPANQQSALEQWVSNSQPVTVEMINEQLGAGTWVCTSSISIVVTGRYDNLLVQYPFVSLDMDEVKYGVGDTAFDVRSATLWGAFRSIC